jgi:hypothetical protein
VLLIILTRLYETFRLIKESAKTIWCRQIGASRPVPLWCDQIADPASNGPRHEISGMGLSPLNCLTNVRPNGSRTLVSLACLGVDDC